MVGLVVIALHPSQQFQDCHAAGNEAAVGAQNHQNHCHKEPEQRFYGILEGDGDPVAHSQKDKAHQGQQPVGLGFPLPGADAVQQLHGLGFPQLPQAVHQHEGGIEGEGGGGAQKCPGEELDGVTDLEL